MNYPKEILEFLQNPDELKIEKKNNIAVINPADLSLIEFIYPEFENIFIVSENKTLIKQASQKYDNVKIVNGNALQTGLKDKSVSNIFIDKSALHFDADKMRIEFRRILENYWCDLVIFENKTESKQNEIIPQKFLEDIFAGSWYEKKNFITAIVK